MYFTYERIGRIVKELSKYRYPDSMPVTSFKFKEGNFRSCEYADSDLGAWVPFLQDDRWGGRDKHYWFRTCVEIPAEFNGKTVLLDVKTGREDQWDATNPQFLIYVNRQLVQGLDVKHTGIALCQNAAAGDAFNIDLHAYTGMTGGLVELKASISILDRDVENLYYDIKVPLEIAGLLDKEDKRQIDILNYLNEAINRLDLRKPFSESFMQSVKEAAGYLESEFYDKYCGCNDVTATCVGHTHIDVAWLWTVAQSREKAARSFSTVLSLMEQYPEYIFMSSQPQLYQFVKEDYPDLYEKIRSRIKEGRWEAEGAMWLEADCNLSSGESLVRQVLYGTRFFEREFGVKNKILWLPDVFGYSAALPQILKKSGIDYFMTTKISWNEYNKLPYDTFMWKGLDGTEILTHFITTRDYQNPVTSHFTTYNGEMIPKEIMGAWQRYQHKEMNEDVLVAFGHGDGGGGPTKEMLENARRMGKGIPGCPKVNIGNTLDYFKRLETQVSGNKRLPKWVGELYFEYHRGTYTSMARNKKYNRKSEFLYQDAELMSVINNLVVNSGAYPQTEISKGWETILLNQFHDILPGSSIREVYDNTLKEYMEITCKGRKLVENALKSITDKIRLEDDSIIVFNQLGFVRSDIVEFEIPDGYEFARIWEQSGKGSPVQYVDGKRCLFFAENVPAKGYKAFKLEKAMPEEALSEKAISEETAPEKAMTAEIAPEKVTSEEAALEKIMPEKTATDKHMPGKALQLPNREGAAYVSLEQLVNRFFIIKLDKDFNIVSIFDRENNRELLKAGERANVLQAFEDKPHDFDAWDINIYYQEKMWEIDSVESAEVVENGPVRASLRIRRSFLDSVIMQDISIYSDMPRIDFKTSIDWKEKQVLLKAAFPVDIHAEKATFEIQFGNIERPTHWNTSWDYARFEVCAHKWADLSEDDYGISLLNDCKYGHDVKEGVMRLTLLKSAVDPNEAADRERHEFTYSLYPHAGDWKEAGTVQMGYALNCPMYSVVEESHAGDLSSEFSLVNIDSENVIIEVVKKAEGSDDIIVRLYECYNRRTLATLYFLKEIAQVWECSLMEENQKEIAVNGDQFSFEIKPYEIKTFKLRVK